MKGLEGITKEINTTTIKENDFSEVFLHHVMDSMSSSMYLLDRNRQIVSMNRAAREWMQKKETGIVGSLFGNAITCSATTQGNKCGTTTTCEACKLKEAIEQAFSKAGQLQQVPNDTKFIVDEVTPQIRYLKYNVQALAHKGKRYALLILDDITHIEEQKLREEEKNKQLISGLTYARHLQKTMLPTRQKLEEALPGMVLFYQPKNIIGGDFYWIHQTPKSTFVALADCTGHGIPGAMLSILGISSLNLIVKERGVTAPAEILNQLRESFVESMQQQDIQSSSDGMDISVCRMDRNNPRLTFAGANNGLVLINPTGIRMYKGNKMPVGKYAKMTSFTEQTIPLWEDDRIYLFSDGYKDQFGGPRNKKLKRQPFMQLLQQTTNLKPQDLYAFLSNQFIQWKGTNEQTDDIALLTFRAPYSNK
ncbi:MAG: SpoIIE family protein phosphatase [Bacteroidota bacterium]